MRTCPVYLLLITDTSAHHAQRSLHTHTLHYRWKLGNLVKPWLGLSPPSNTLWHSYTKTYRRKKNSCTSYKYGTGTYSNTIICQLTFTHQSCPSISGIIDTETTQSFLPHREYAPRQKQLVNNWCCQSATVLSEGTACKCNWRNVKTLTSNYLSPKAMAGVCYWREAELWAGIEKSLTRCCRQIQ